MRYTCKNCGCELPDDAQFCTHCGTKVSAPRCPSCGRILPEDAAFCTFCGTRLVPEETRAENTTEQSVESLPEDPTVELEPTSSEKAPESVSSPAEAASASLPTQQACPSESVPLPPNAPPDAAQPSAEEQAVPSASEPIEEEHPDTASDHAGNASPVPAPDVPALPADAEPPAFLLDGKSDIFQRLKQYEQNGDTRSEEYSRLRKQEKSAYFWCKLMAVLVYAIMNIVGYFLFGQYSVLAKLGVFIVSILAAAPICVVICSRISQKCGIKITTGFLSIFSDKSVSQEEEKIAEAGMDYCMNCIQERHGRAYRVFEILMAIAGVLSVVCAILCLSVGMGFWDSIRFGVLLWLEIGFLMAVVWTWKGWLLLPLLPLVVLYASSKGMLMGYSPLMNYLDSADSTAASGPSQAETAPDTSAVSDSCVTLGDAWLGLCDGRTIVVISYSWTNTTGSEDSAIYNVSLHGYQNGIELEKAYFADIDNASQTRNVKPGATIQLEEAFYLDDPYADLLVEAAPWLALDDTIYASTLYTHQEANSTGGAAFSDLVGEYSYDASFEAEGMYVNFYYALLIYGQSQSVQISEYWRGNAIFDAVWASEDSWDGSTLYFDVAPRDSDYDDMAGTHFLTFVPAAESPYGVDTIYIDGDTDMPFTRDSY